jgi:hypothetical protein
MGGLEDPTPGLSVYVERDIGPYSVQYMSGVGYLEVSVSNGWFPIITYALHSGLSSGTGFEHSRDLGPSGNALSEKGSFGLGMFAGVQVVVPVTIYPSTDCTSFLPSCAELSGL